MSRLRALTLTDLCYFLKAALSLSVLTFIWFSFRLLISVMIFANCLTMITGLTLLDFFSLTSIPSFWNFFYIEWNPLISLIPKHPPGFVILSSWKVYLGPSLWSFFEKLWFDDKTLELLRSRISRRSKSFFFSLFAQVHLLWYCF